MLAPVDAIAEKNMADSILASEFKTDPYWWDAAPRPTLPPTSVPQRVDVAIVGSGFTGLAAALALARAGRDTLVIEAEDPGHGASSRNAGYVGRTLWRKFGRVRGDFGEKRAVSLASAAVEAHRFVVELLEQEQIRCGFVYCGRFIGAYTRRHYDALAEDYELMRRLGIDIEVEMVPRAEQHREAGTDGWHGGMVVSGVGALHPGLYHLGLLDRARAAGARIVANTPVTGIVREGAELRVRTARGDVVARDVVVATNGYTGAATPWFRRRIVPVKAYQIATEPLSPRVLDRVLPTRRTTLDSKNNIYWIRPSPDGTRIIMGGRTGMEDGGLRTKAEKLHAALASLFPDLADVRVTHCWEGQMAFTFDWLPHVGSEDGIHYAVGYNGAGLPMGTYLGHKAALKVLGKREGETAFDGLGFPTRPFYSGNPWMLPAIVGYQNLRDRLDALLG
jgi:glycine/D-amino acid oxidase-like deaminating enzyme